MQTLILKIAHDDKKVIADFLIRMGEALRDETMHEFGNIFDPNKPHVSVHWEKGDIVSLPR